MTKKRLVERIIHSGNLDLIGETLRILAFPNSKPHAAYFADEVRQDATRLTREEIQNLYEFMYGLERDNVDGHFFMQDIFDSSYDICSVNGYIFQEGQFTINVTWTFDGHDGELLFFIQEDGQSILHITNTDCKCTYGWKEIELDKIEDDEDEI
ncbi:MAG: hypothetical protein HYW78_00920 [Parcubacteria group bacterium]|nr:hypothetical protein [Parcubacteria group bacterium]